MLAAGTFRSDLFYRLSVFPIHLPPLRERPSDIVPLAENILRSVTRRLGKGIVGIAEEATALLQGYGWPGNIRELQNVVERAAILCQGDQILPAYLNLTLGSPAPAATGPRMLRELEREAILAALSACQGNRRGAAEQLGIGLRTLYTRLREYGIFSDQDVEE